MLPIPIDSITLQPREIAKALGISQRTLWSLPAPRGPIPCLRVGSGKRRSVLLADGLDEAANGRWADPWNYIVRCRYGHLYPVDGNRIGTPRPPTRVDRRY